MRVAQTANTKEGSSKTDERNSIQKLTLLLNTSQGFSFRRSNSPQIETISMEPDQRRKQEEKNVSLLFSPTNFHLNSKVLVQTANTLSSKQPQIGNIFSTKPYQQNRSLNEGKMISQDFHHTSDLSQQVNSFRLGITNRQQSFLSQPQNESSHPNIFSHVHGLSKSSLIGNPVKSLPNQFNPISNNFITLGNPTTFSHNSPSNISPSHFNLTSSMFNGTQSEQQKDIFENNTNNSSSQIIQQKPYHRPNSRSLGNAMFQQSPKHGSNHLISINEKDNNDHQNGSVNDLLKVTRTAQGIFRSQKISASDAYIQSSNSLQSVKVPISNNHMGVKLGSYQQISPHPLFSPVSSKQSAPTSSKKIQTNFYHSSLRHIDFLEEPKFINQSEPQKKILSFQTSSALLPQSLMNITKNFKKISSPSPVSLNSITTPSLIEVFPIRETNHTAQTDNQEKLKDKDGSLDKICERKIESKFFTQIQSNKNDINEQNNQQPQSGQKSKGYQLFQKSATTEPASFHRIIQYEQTPEQKKFQIEFLQKIRSKQMIQGKQIKLQSQENGGRQLDLTIPQSTNQLLMNLMDKHNNIKQSELSLKDQSCTPSNIIEKFSKILSEDLMRQNNPIGRAYAFFLSDVKPNYFFQIVIQLFSNAFPELLDSNLSSQFSSNKKNLHSNNLNYQINNNTNNNSKGTKQKRNPFKIPEKFFWILVNVFKQRVLISSFNYSQSKLEEFTFRIQDAYQLLGIKPANLLEELGGRKRCERLLVEFSTILNQELKLREISEKSVIDIGMAVLMDDEESLDKQIEAIKLGKTITSKELFKIKFIIYQFLTERESFLDSETKSSFLQQFEKIRYNHFTNFSKINLDSITTDILKFISTKKPILEYFQEEHKQNLIQIFVIQILECLLFRLKPSVVVAWLGQNISKQPDDSFYFMIESLFLEPFKQQKVGNIFLKNCELKFFWLRMTANLTFDTSMVVQRIDELLSSTRTWIDGMVTQHQLTKQQMQNVTEIQNLSFLKCFIQSIFTEDSFSVVDIKQLLSIFSTSSDSVLFQLKGLKRILLIMRFKPNEAYEIAEFFLKIFTESLSAFTSQ